MTDGDEDGKHGERAPDFSEKASFMLSQGEQAYRQAVRYLRSVKGKEVPADEIAAVVGPLTAALDPPRTESVVRLIDLLNAHASHSSAASAGAQLTAAAVLAASADAKDVIDDVTVMGPKAENLEDVGKLFNKAAEHGIGDLSTSQLLVVVLVILLTIGLPFAQVQLSPEAQTLMTDEEATIGIGFAITLAIVQSRKK